MHPDQIVGLDQRLHRLGEAFVDAGIAGVEIALELGQVDPIVEERPQRPVGIAVIIFVDILLFQVDGRGGDSAALLEVDMAAELVGGLPDQPNQMPPFSRKAARSATASPP